MGGTMNLPEASPSRPRRFSLIRSFVLADFLTLGNGFCGCGSVLAAMQYLVTGEARWLVTAMVLLPIAGIFDFADGRVARWRHRSSSLGADLDSLADVISFGLAPAALGFAMGLRGADESPQPLQVRMRKDRRHQEFRDSASPVIGHDEDIGNVGERRQIRNG